MDFTKSLMIALFVCAATPATAIAGERAALHDPAPSSRGQIRTGQHAPDKAASVNADPLDRVTDAVDGAESSHGKDPAMWRIDPAAPQGPMQVSEAAATDVGGGDRFDLAQNRTLGRAYLSQLFWRYRNWPDAIAAYNWGIGKMDAWVKAGRPPDQFLVGVAVYLQRVLHASGLCDGAVGATPVRASSPAAKVAMASQPIAKPQDPSVSAACAAPDPAAGAFGLTAVTNRFYKQLDTALQLAVRRAAQDR